MDRLGAADQHEPRAAVAAVDVDLEDRAQAARVEELERAQVEHDGLQAVRGPETLDLRLERAGARHVEVAAERHDRDRAVHGGLEGERRHTFRTIDGASVIGDLAWRGLGVGRPGPCLRACAGRTARARA